MAVIPMRRWMAPVGVSVSLIIAAAGASAEPIVPAGPGSTCGEAHSAPSCGDDKPAPGSRGPAAQAPALPLQILAPPPGRSAPSTNTPAGALVPPAPGPAGATPIVPSR
ncbi:hypothetical protein ACFZC5_15405 [Nocardia gamkensis]|uniref:hypothetical protein n=1 Tax=Nocardia gamkensis TaxID=352869 RepID=UPI0036E54173